ncbi:MAG: leucyl/phenylalanyl-tRNA--protein transferase [Reyranellaceae bacterium]
MAGLTPDLLLQAYAVGLFPMAERRDDPTLYWIDPDQRAILPLDGFHLSRRLARTVRANRFEIRCDTAFAEVMRACAESTQERRETWINEPILQLYTALFHRGHAHSVEAWREGQLVGGLYGVSLGGAFFGESMFSRQTDASKVALVHLVARLKAGGYVLLDCQFMTEHLRQFGVVEISREDYRRRLARALRVEAEFQRDLMGAAESLVLQPITQTS